METGTMGRDGERQRQFKSYYVVWKPKDVFACLLFLLWFKSYYVVWKQQIMCDEKSVEV